MSGYIVLTYWHLDVRYIWRTNWIHAHSQCGYAYCSTVDMYSTRTQELANDITSWTKCYTYFYFVHISFVYKSVIFSLLHNQKLPDFRWQWLWPSVSNTIRVEVSPCHPRRTTEAAPSWFHTAPTHGFQQASSVSTSN